VLSSTNTNPVEYDSDGRTPFSDPKLKGLENLTETAKASLLHHHRLGKLGETYGLEQVIRWKPKIVSLKREALRCPFIANISQTDDLGSSGLYMVTAQALYAIVGAVALERGGADANRVVKEKILKPLGLQVPS
jgi:large subunit ribosomal protein L15